MAEPRLHAAEVRRQISASELAARPYRRWRRTRDFFVRGRGTLAPWDPPRALVAEGLYRYCRNPMYVGVLLLIWGEGVWWRSGEVVVYGYLIALIFHLRVLWYEEPWLARTFPTEWDRYRASVRRWGAF